MTVLEWLQTAGYNLGENTFVKIALERDCNPNDDVFDTLVVSQKQKDLMRADVIYEAVVMRPSNTSSVSESHNGYQRTVGSESDTYRADKIKIALALYEKWGDAKAEELNGLSKKIRFIHIQDVL